MRIPRYSIASLLAVVGLLCLGIVTCQYLWQRHYFSEAIHNTRENITGGNSTQRGKAVLKAIDNLNYRNRLLPELAFSGITTYQNGRTYLWADWVVSRNEIDGIKIRLKSGKSIGAQFPEFHYDEDPDYFYFNAAVWLDTIGLSDPGDIDKISLTSDGLVVTDWVNPVGVPR